MNENKAIEFLAVLGITNCTSRHVSLVSEFLTKGDFSNVESLLDELGGWDSVDLKKANEFLKVGL